MGEGDVFYSVIKVLILEQQSECSSPADVVGLARVLQRQAVGCVLVLVGADGDNCLAPPLGAGRLVSGRT